MEYELFLNTKLQREEVGGLLYKIVSAIIDEEVELKKIKYTLGYQYVFIKCRYFSIDIDLDDEDNDMEEYQKINTKYHSINTNMRISIEMLSKTFRTGWLKLLQIIGVVLKTIDGELLLLDDTSFQ